MTKYRFKTNHHIYCKTGGGNIFREGDILPYDEEQQAIVGASGLYPIPKEELLRVAGLVEGETKDSLMNKPNTQDKDWELLKELRYYHGLTSHPEQQKQEKKIVEMFNQAYLQATKTDIEKQGA